MIVEIKLMSREKNDKIQVVDDKIFVNGKQKNTDAENFLRRLFCIVSTWEKSMVNLNIIDGESYSVKIDDGENKEEYFGKNKFPKNYGDFTKLISEITSL